MSKIVFILGAGASAKIGGPLMSNFLDIARDLWAAGLTGGNAKSFEQVFRVIGKMQPIFSKARIDLDNIESVFTALELGKVIRRFPGLETDEIDGAINSLKQLIAHTLELRIKFDGRSSGIHAKQPYAAFSEAVCGLHRSGKSVSITTFNYDVALDVAIFNRGFSSIYRIGHDVGSAESSVDVLKLHGSLNWASTEDKKTKEKRIVPLRMEDYFSKNNPRWDDGKEVNFRIASDLAEFFQKHKSFEVLPAPVIVPPTWNKADYHSALSDVWSAAAQHLSEAEHIVVIGYSLPPTDAFFRHLYALGSVSEIPLQSFIVLNRSARDGSVDRRFKRLLGHGALARYHYIQGDFSEGSIDAIVRFVDKKLVELPKQI